jgi:hypothetical protein
MYSSMCVYTLTSKGAATCKTYISSSESNGIISFSLVNPPCTTYSAHSIRLAYWYLITTLYLVLYIGWFLTTYRITRIIFHSLLVDAHCDLEIPARG